MTERGGRADLFIGRRLELERLVARMSPVELAKALGIDCQCLREYERGERRMPARQLTAAMAILGVPLSLFCYDKERRGSSPPEVEIGPWYTVPRPPKRLSRSDFAQAHPVLRRWKANRGEMTDEMLKGIVAGRLMPRTILFRQPAGSSRLLFEHFGAITIMRPCTAFSLVGREVDAMPDPDYGAWMIEAYARTAWDRQLRLDLVLAEIGTTDMDGAIVRARYDRVLIPWRGRGGETFILCLSLLRHRAVI